MDLPLEILKEVSQTIPAERGMPHALTWDPEVGFELALNLGGGYMPFRFDYGEKIEDIRKQISRATGVPMPGPDADGEQKKGSAVSVTPLLDNIKAAGITPAANRTTPLTNTRSNSRSANNLSLQERLRRGLAPIRTLLAPDTTTSPNKNLRQNINARQNAMRELGIIS